VLIALSACTPADSGALAGDSADALPSGYAIRHWTDPDPIDAGVEAELFQQVTLDGQAVPDLQASHERYLHTTIFSRDLAAFAHAHHEDSGELTADDIRASTFHFPVLLPAAGDYLASVDYAHRDQWLHTTYLLPAVGTPAQAAAADLSVTTTSADADATATLTWEVAPLATAEATFTVHLADGSGTAITDLVPWLGADAHAAFVAADLSWAGHSHAWFPGMEDMKPNMTMPHVYGGPDLPFHYAFPAAGMFKTWIQFTRATDPARVYAIPFVFEVT
jgi:hypothetical protein